MIRVEVALKIGAFDLDVAFENGAGITALFGRSGSGKSMTINLIAGLARPDRGSIVLDGRVLVDTETSIFVPTYRRRVGLVFQDAQLFPHLSIRRTLLFGSWFAPKTARTIAFGRVVETLGIEHLLKRKPARLSGGEKQSVAIGRALLASPEILLMDEPLASLDTERKLEILPLIESLRDDLRIPIVYVSHSVDEVARLASRVVVLEDGHVLAAGSVDDVFGPACATPASAASRGPSVVTGRLSDRRCRIRPHRDFEHPAGTIWLTGCTGPAGREVRVVVKATDITLAKAPAQSLSVRTTLCGVVAGIETDGPLAGVSVDLDGHGHLFALATRKAVDELELHIGDRVFALVKSVALDERAVVAVDL